MLTQDVSGLQFTKVLINNARQTLQQHIYMYNISLIIAYGQMMVPGWGQQVLTPPKGEIEYLGWVGL